jgi:hypothetical protein
MIKPWLIPKIVESSIYTTWDPSAKHANITLSEGDLKNSSSTTSARSVRGVSAKSSGKWYFEYTVVTAGDDQSIGICDSSFDVVNATNAFWANASGYAYLNYNGNKGNNGSSTSYGASWASNNDVAMVAVNLDSGRIWFGKNGTWQISGDPVAGTNYAFTGLSGTFYPLCTMGAAVGGNPVGKANFGTSAFAYTLPTGFSGWTA